MAMGEQQERRQHPRTHVSWPTVMEVGSNRYACEAVDISTHGAKVRTRLRLKTGTAVRLEFVPSEGPSLRVGALVWRLDSDGLALMFARGIQHRFIRAA